MSYLKPQQHPAVFLDRDGVINVDFGYVHKPEQLQLCPHVKEALMLLQDQGFKLIIISNQSGIARGLFSEEDVNSFHKHLINKLGPQVIIDGIYFCPHHPEGRVEPYQKKCHCRKPATGMIEQAAQDHAINLADSFMIGDKDTDIECAHRLKIPAIQVNNGQYGWCDQADYHAAHLLEAAQWIMKQVQKRSAH